MVCALRAHAIDFPDAVSHTKWGVSYRASPLNTLVCVDKGTGSNYIYPRINMRGGLGTLKYLPDGYRKTQNRF